MATYVPPKRATQYIFWLALVSRSTGQFQASPTLAAGDVKVSIDGGALANLTTLPTVTPAASIWVKVTVSVSEMTGDNILVQFIDAAGAEWNDVAATIQTVTKQNDDLLSTSATDLNSIADALLKRDMSAVTGEAARSLLNALRFLRNKWSITAGTLTVTKEDDTTTAWTAAVTTAAGDPVTSVDPT